MAGTRSLYGASLGKSGLTLLSEVAVEVLFGAEPRDEVLWQTALGAL
jgi:hypothetical protein